MILEWLRRRDSALDGFLRTYLFTLNPVLEIEKDGEAKQHPGTDLADGSLGIGSLERRSES
jgi:hypothetical protein